LRVRPPEALYDVSELVVGPVSAARIITVNDEIVMMGRTQPPIANAACLIRVTLSCNGLR
jgi:hypothetical protein